LDTKISNLIRESGIPLAYPMKKRNQKLRCNKLPIKEMKEIGSSILTFPRKTEFFFVE
jgi:hypothetical protein